jgi:hypothetical protein
MRRRSVFLTLAFAGVANAALAVEPPYESGVREAENRWSEAFVTGDAARLNALLDPGYVSVNALGVARTKAEIIAAAANYAAKNPGQHADPMSATSTIRVIGGTAVVRHNGPAETSVDVFYYSGGRWRAIYSQHTAKGAVG